MEKFCTIKLLVWKNKQTKLDKRERTNFPVIMIHFKPISGHPCYTNYFSQYQGHFLST